MLDLRQSTEIFKKLNIHDEKETLVELKCDWKMIVLAETQYDTIFAVRYKQ